MMFTEAEEREKAMEWFKGNEHVVSFVSAIAHAEQVADDIVDEDWDQGTRASAMARLFERLLVMPANPFYAAHLPQLLPLILTGVIEWECSNEWQRSSNKDTRAFGYVRREALEGLMTYCAYLVGGIDWAMHVARDIHDYYHVEHADDETVDTWGMTDEHEQRRQSA